ncbi:hypothetical protein [Flavobacterium sp.]|uniref:hypothetical protein n=1 Tax=Flavobacterium sp. TaxID=239 RepID=UPI0025F2A988|nr:hypothetical protein [Flavobacterium sp.]
MKTLKSICISLVLFTTFSNAQITKGNWMVGGYGSFSSKKSTTKDNSGTANVGIYREIEISPNIGYFVINQLAFGVRLGYQGEFYPGNDNVTEQNYITLSSGFFARYYFLKPEKLINIFAEGDYLIGNRHGSSWGFDSFDTSINGYKIMVGSTLFFNSSVGLELTLQYSSQKSLFNQTSVITDDFQVGLGFQIYLEKNN